MDADGAIWTSPAQPDIGVVRVGEDGEVLDEIELDIACFATGRRDALEELFRRYRGPAYRVAHRLLGHEADALEFDLAALARERGARLRVIGNLPYNISTPLLFHVAAAHEYIDDLHVMLQKEVIDRIVAAPGSTDYGRLTVMLAPWMQAQHLFDVGPGAFTPAPRVWSAVARLTVRRAPAFEVPRAFARTVSAAFSQRRKTLRNALRALLDADNIVAAGIDPGLRPETLSPAQFAALAARVPEQ